MKTILALSLLVLVSGCSTKPLKMEINKPVEEKAYTKDQVRRACWKGIKQACGVKGSCYEKAGNYCETEKMYQDVLATPGVPKK